jgi:hypothetical protein
VQDGKMAMLFKVSATRACARGERARARAHARACSCGDVRARPCAVGPALAASVNRFARHFGQCLLLLAARACRCCHAALPTSTPAAALIARCPP